MLDRRHYLMPLVTKLKVHAPLDDDDCAAVLALPHVVRTLEPMGYFIREGDPPVTCCVLIDGYAMRQKLTGEGARQILSLHISGDPLDFQGLFLTVADHNVQALTRAEVAIIPRAAMQQLIEARPPVARAVLVNILVEQSIAREWLLNIGRRDARTRLAHFLCEFALRLDTLGLNGGEYELPMTQEQLGDALGLTAVHVNRTLKMLEREGVLRRVGRRITFPHWRQFRSIADFSSMYLHIGLQDH